jgi:anti-sigma factor RsiW
MSGFAGVAAGVALTLLISTGRPWTDDTELRSVLDSHIRSLMVNHLTDVVSSDQHTVKPWLSARLNLSPTVRDYAAEGFPLIGGRLDYVDGHPAAAVVYRRAGHVINLFAWASPGHPDSRVHLQQEQGFNAANWRYESITYYAISDVDVRELTRFIRLVRDGAMSLANPPNSPTESQ